MGKREKKTLWMHHKNTNKKEEPKKSTPNKEIYRTRKPTNNRVTHIPRKQQGVKVHTPCDYTQHKYGT